MRINGSVIGSNVTPSFLSGATGVWSMQNVELANRQIIWPTNIVTNGLVLFLDANNTNSYPGSGTSWYDLSGNGNTGTLTNGPTFSSASGGSISFDGTDDYVAITNLFLNTITNITLQGWVYISSTSLKGPFVKVGGGVNGYAIGVGGNDFDTSGNQIIGLYAGVRWILTGNNYGTGWKFFTLTLSTTSVPTFYLNGALIGSYTGTNPLTPTSGAYVGRNVGDELTVRAFAGNIATTQIYNRELTATEILQNYNATKTRFGL
jgi:hypothetical protein